MARTYLADVSVGSPTVNITVFGVLVLVTLVIVVRVGRTNRTASDYYTAGQSFTGPQNGVAIAGDFLSVASFLGVAGLTAQYGYDGFMLAVGALVTWLVALLLVAEPLRNTGRYTMGDVIAFRTRQAPVRAAAAVSTLVVTIFYLLTQLVGAGGLITLLLQIPKSNTLGQNLVLVVTGLLMIFYVLAGGMKGTTWVQIIKAGLLMVSTLILAFWLLGRYGFDVSLLLADAAAKNQPAGEALLAPGLQYPGPLDKLDSLSQTVALVLGSAALPHVLMRFYTVPTAGEARRSVVWAIWLIGAFYVALTIVGFGAAAMVGSDRVATAPGGSNSAVPLLAYRLGGELMLGIVSAVAFATILAVVAGLTIAASASFAHDLYARVLRRGRTTSGQQELRVARLTAIVIGACAIGGAMAARGQNVGFLAILAFAIAASANLPTLLYSLFWRRFTTTGALCSVYGGIALSLGLIVVSPAVSGAPTSMFPDMDFAVFPLANPGLVSIPASFLFGAVGSLLGPRDPEAGRRFAELEVRAFSGARNADAVPVPEPVPVDVWSADGPVASAGPGEQARPVDRDVAPVPTPGGRIDPDDAVTMPVRTHRDSSSRARMLRAGSHRAPGPGHGPDRRDPPGLPPG